MRWVGLGRSFIAVASLGVGTLSVIPAYDASVGTFVGNLLYNTGITEAAAAPEDIETAGVSALLAGAVGIGLTIMGKKLSPDAMNPALSSGALSDAWNWAHAQVAAGASWLGGMASYSASNGLTMTMSTSMSQAIQGFWSQEASQHGWLTTGMTSSSVVDDQTGTPYTINSYSDTQGIFAAATAGTPAASEPYQVLFNNGAFDAWYASNEPITIQYSLLNGGTVLSWEAASAGDVLYYGNGDFLGSWQGAGGYATATASSPGQVIRIGQGAQFSSANTLSMDIEAGAASAASVTGTSFLQPGHKVYVPPVYQSPSGDIGVSIPVTNPTTGDVGLTADGTDVYSPSDGTTTTVQDVNVASNMGVTQAQITSTWLEDLIKPVRNTITDVLAPWTAWIDVWQSSFGTCATDALPPTWTVSSGYSVPGLAGVSIAPWSASWWSSHLSTFKTWVGWSIWAITGIAVTYRMFGYIGLVTNTVGSYVGSEPTQVDKFGNVTSTRSSDAQKSRYKK